MLATKSTKKLANLAAQWDEAIQDARKKIWTLEAAIRAFQEKKKRGEPWPGSQNAATHN
jgi:hypothetical protein